MDDHALRLHPIRKRSILFNYSVFATAAVKPIFKNHFPLALQNSLLWCLFYPDPPILACAGQVEQQILRIYPGSLEFAHAALYVGDLQFHFKIFSLLIMKLKRLYLLPRLLLASLQSTLDFHLKYFCYILEYGTD
ncbi:hypothetical protein SAMN06296241_3183 [Salinimicrobium sediminis]|uniref:Uncharacterized protein n=1 Tax=Salinimicrobium sediminis TaxID=1343891 RepID=A0A285X8F9_9FLAO|nr:hypothetical protein SAMN06296241_3183 [Salinimicrobium sediminis]